MQQRIKETETNNSRYLPMINFFNSLTDRNFKETVIALAKDTGVGVDFYSCSFASNWHPLEEGYFESGVMFVDSNNLEETTVIVDYSTFYKYLRIACENYLGSHPQHKDIIENAMISISQRYKIETLK